MAVLQLDPANKSANISLTSPAWETASNLLATTAVTGASAWQTALSTVFQSSGKWYFEFTWTEVTANNWIFGLSNNTSPPLTSFLGSNAGSFGLERNNSILGGGGTPGWSVSGFVIGTRFGMAVDVTAKKYWLRGNGGAWMNGDPVAGTGGGTWSFSGAVCPGISLSGNSAVAGRPFCCSGMISGSLHDFAAAPPTGYSAWGDTSSYATPAQTFDPAWSDSTTAFSGGNLTTTFGTGSSGANFGWRSQVGTTIITAPQTYFEVTCVTTAAASSMVGISAPIVDIQNFSGGQIYGTQYENDGRIFYESVQPATTSTYTSGDVIGVAVDLSLKKMWFRKNSGVWFGGTSPDPTLGSGGYDITTLLGFRGGFVPCVSSIAQSSFTLVMSGFTFVNPFFNPGVLAPNKRAIDPRTRYEDEEEKFRRYSPKSAFSFDVGSVALSQNLRKRDPRIRYEDGEEKFRRYSPKLAFSFDAGSVALSQNLSRRDPRTRYEDETDTYRRPIRSSFVSAPGTFEITPWLGAETFLDASGNPTVLSSYMGMESWISDQTVTFGKVDYLGTEVFLAHVGLSGAYTAQLMLETWLLAATDEKGVESTKLGAENWLVPASWSAQIPKLASEVFLVVPFTTATIFVPKIGSEVFMEKSGQSSAFIPKMGVEVFFPNVSSLTGTDEVNIVIWMH